LSCLLFDTCSPWTRAPTTFSNEFFRLLVDEEWAPKKWDGPLQYENSKSGGDLMMLPTDIALIEDPSFRYWVEKYAANEELFFNDFAAAFSQMLELGVSFHSSESKKVVSQNIRVNQHDTFAIG
jgi:cytochrome c peroxidase